jgi:hypothetical protein
MIPTGFEETKRGVHCKKSFGVASGAGSRCIQGECVYASEVCVCQ